MHHNLLRLIIIISTFFLLSACTQKYQNLSVTFDEALFGFDDAHTSAQEIKALPYASSHVIIDKNAQIFMVLALAEPANTHPKQIQLKWLSSDYAMLVTENGRLIKTLRLPTDNLMAINHQHFVDPLHIIGKKPDHHTWQASYDWQPHYRFNYTAQFTWHFIGSEIIHSAAWEKETNYYQEHVMVSALGIQFTNHFWLDKNSHQVVKSLQYIGPDMSSIEITFLKPFSG